MPVGTRALITLLALAAIEPQAARAQAPRPPSVPERYAADDASPPPGSERPAADAVRLDALGWGERPLTLHVGSMSGSEESTASCAAPCQLDVAPGRYRLAVQPRGGDPRDADGDPLTLRPGGRLAVQMTYDHRIGERSVGWTFLCIALSVVVSVAPLDNPTLMAVIAAPIAGAFMIPAIALIFLEDSARVEVAPLAPPGGGVAIP